MSIIKIYKFLQTLIFLLLLIYFSQGILYEQGSIISRGALAFILLISGSFFVIEFFKSDNKLGFYKIWTFLFLLNIIGFLFFTPEYGGYYFSFFKSVLLNFIIFYPFYFFARAGLLKAKVLIRFFVAFLPITIALYFSSLFQIMEELNREQEMIVSNVSYIFVFLIPYTFLFKKNRIISFITMLILLYFIIQGSKRGALLVGGVATILFAYNQLRNLKGRAKIIAGTLSGISIIGIFYYAYLRLMENQFVIERMQMAREGSFSGREIIFKNLWRAWVNSGDALNYLFGYGFAASLRLSGGSYAHNDWLEMMTNFGILGIISYFLFFGIGFNMLLVTGWKKDKRILMITLIIMWFLTGLGSMALYSGHAFLLVILFAYIVGSKSSLLN